VPRSHGEPRPGPARGRPSSPPPPASEPARERFLRADPYRAVREWDRVEGTPQRDLFRVLRTRFLRRHQPDSAWALDVGAGPGRFTPFIGGSKGRTVALDLSRAMLEELARHQPAGAGSFPDRVLADALRPPFPDGAFGVVAALGNVLGFSEADHEQLLTALERLVAPAGLLLVEVAPGPGLRSRYLHRLPPSAVARLLRSPRSLVRSRIAREGFEELPPRHESPHFARIAVPELREHWTRSGWEVLETVAVAPALGPEAERIEAAWSAPESRLALIELEEAVGSEPANWASAAAVLLAVRAPARRHP
jgi:SAM-dependent methyltransferase